MSGSADELRWWFIPTCVGKSTHRSLRTILHRVHPHVCGEKTIKQVKPLESRGSSPRVWGKVEKANWTSFLEWFIPTCVGKRSLMIIPPLGGSVHPHVCGEKSQPGDCMARPPGSSPRVWGKGCQSGKRNEMKRFIPTCVGKRSRFLWMKRAKVVHPHVCGEKCRILWSRKRDRGSSPRVWGKVPRYVFSRPILWFIPTCVGKSR